MQQWWMLANCSLHPPPLLSHTFLSSKMLLFVRDDKSKTLRIDLWPESSLSVIFLFPCFSNERFFYRCCKSWIQFNFQKSILNEHSDLTSKSLSTVLVKFEVLGNLRARKQVNHCSRKWYNVSSTDSTNLLCSKHCCRCWVLMKKQNR